MTKPSTILIVFLCLAFVNCKGTEEHPFPLDKRYWAVQDYKDATLELNFGYESDEMLPNFKDPETRAIVEKLTDHQNYIVVLDDKELGLKHKNQVAEKFFRICKDMSDIYQARDLKDNYRYEQEMLAVEQFGMGLQLKYFKLGNDEIIASADDPESDRVKKRIHSNVATLTGNFILYLDEINNEASFSDEGKASLAKGIDTYFTQLVNLYPDANYKVLERKVELMEKKSQSPVIKTSLAKLNTLIDSKKAPKVVE